MFMGIHTYYTMAHHRINILVIPGIDLITQVLINADVNAGLDISILLNIQNEPTD